MFADIDRFVIARKLKPLQHSARELSAALKRKHFSNMKNDNMKYIHVWNIHEL